MKIIQYLKKMSPSNAGLTEMNDVYITVSKKANPILIFGDPPLDINFEDITTKEIINLKFKLENNGEYRLSKLGQYVRNKKAKEDDNIYIEKRISNGNEIKFFIDLYKTNNTNITYPSWQKYEFQIDDEKYNTYNIDNRKLLIKEVAEKVVLKHGYVLQSTIKGYVRFLTKNITNIIPKTSVGNWLNKESFLFEIEYRMDYVSLKFTISPGDERVRNILKEITSILPGSRKAKGKQWLVNYIYTEKVNLLDDKFDDSVLLEKVFDDLLDKNKTQIETMEREILNNKNRF
jgi:hypothetical protein